MSGVFSTAAPRMSRPTPLFPLLDNRDFSAATQALMRIHSADYGLCVDCQLSIAFERLQLEPHALRCITCQTLHERKH